MMSNAPGFCTKHCSFEQVIGCKVQGGIGRSAGKGRPEALEQRCATLSACYRQKGIQNACT